ncbi:hypothetical protein P9112_012386 [Eukaryota sp. TZLM1-RC]
MSSLISAVLDNDINTVKQILSSGNFNINQRDTFLRSALHLACSNNNVVVLRLLLQHRFYISAIDANGRTALHYAACSSPDPTCLRTLLSCRGLSINCTDFQNFTPLHLACMKGDSHFFHISDLVSNGADIHALTSKNYSPLMLACESNSPKVVNLLIKVGSSLAAPLDKKDRYRTALHIAVKHNHFSLIPLLLSTNPNPNLCEPRFGSTALHLACMLNHVQCVRALLEFKRTNLLAITDHQWSVLHLAAEHGSLEVIRFLLTVPQIKDLMAMKTKSGRTALHIGVKKRNGGNRGGKRLDILNILSDFIDVNASDSASLTALHLAIHNNFTKAVGLLVQKGGNVEARESRFRYSPLHIAVLQSKFQENSNIFELLIKKGQIDVNITAKFNWTSLMLACLHANQKVVEILLENGASDEFLIDDYLRKDCYSIICSLNTVDESILLDLLLLLINHFKPSSNTLSRAICFCTSRRVFDFLIGKGAKICDFSLEIHCSSKCLNNGGPFFDRSAHDTPLVDSSNSNCTCPQGDPLIYAVKQGQLNLCKWLIGEGADVNCRSARDWTPLMIAGQIDRIDLIELLIDNDADVNSVNLKGRDLFLICCRYGSLCCLTYLHEKNLVPKAKKSDNDGYSGLLLAILHRYEKVVEFLIESRICDPHEDSALMLSIKVGSPSIFKLLISDGNVDVNQSNSDGHTPISLACSINTTSPEILHSLLDLGAETDLIVDGKSVIHLMVENMDESNSFYLNFFNSILADNIDLVNFADFYGRTPLHYSCLYSHYSTARCLLSSGGDLNAIDADGLLPIHLAIKNGSVSFVELLSKFGSPVDSCGKLGNFDSPGVYALNHNQSDCFKLLVAYGCNKERALEIFRKNT